MNTKALRQKILDLAIHGKLLPLEKVEQIRKDEPASVLLEKIRGEKEEKIAKGELKRNKNDSFIFTKDCEFDEDKLGKQSEGLRHKRHYEKFADGSVKDIEDEIPFDIPDGWSWCRLGDVVIDIADIDHKMPKIINDGIPFISPLDFTKDGKIDFINAKKISREDFIRLSRKVKPKKNDIIFPRYGTIGILRYIDTDNDFLVSYSCATIVTNKINTVPLYIFFALQSSLTLEEIEKYKVTTTQSNIGIKSLKQFFLPLPPLTEQQLIVEEIEKIFVQIDLLEQNKTDLQTAIKQAKSKILDLAIHGKLVPQDPNDEPASVLLEKIRVEKEAKIAKGELKRNKNDSYIYKSSTDNCHYEKLNGKDVCIEDELPFTIPDSWQWCRLGEIGTWQSGTTPNRKKIDFYLNGTIPWLLTGDLNDGYITNIPNKITEFAYVSTSLKLNPIDSICIAMYGATIGKLGILTFPATTNQACCVCSNYNGVEKLFLFYFLMNHKEHFIQQGFGGAQPNISKEKIIETFLPLPPLSEQKRIVVKIEELFSLLDQIQTNIV